MPRPLRIEYPGAWYHVMNRGINRMKIFTTDEHRQIFLNLLSEISSLFQIEVHSYCLMDNHYHLLIHTPHPNLGKAMRHLSGLYTLRYNRATHRDGPLFRGRYRAILIEESTYLLKVSRYIHLNPIEAKIAEDPFEFRWSSYSDYVSATKYDWVHTAFILKYFGNSESYVEFIRDGIDMETINFYNQPNLSSVIGSPQFIIEQLSTLSDNYQFLTLPDVNRTKKLLSVEKITILVASYFNVPVATIQKPKQKNNFPRMLAIYFSRYIAQSSNQNISEYFTGLTRFSVSTVLINYKSFIENNSNMKEHYLKLKKIIDCEL